MSLVKRWVRRDTGTSDSLRPVIVIGGVSGGAGTLAFTILAPLLPRYVKHFALSVGQASLVSACFGLGAIAGALAGGLIARRNAKAAVVAGLAALALGTGALGGAGPLRLVELGRVLQGTGDGLAYCGGLTLLFESAPRERQSLLFGTVSAIALLGALAGPVIAYATTRLGSGAVLGALAALGAALAVAATLFPSPPRRTDREPTRAAAIAFSLSWARTIGPSALQASLNGTLNILGPIALSRLGWSTPGIAAAFLGAAAIGGLAYPVAGRLSDRHGTRAVAATLLFLAGANAIWLSVVGGHWAALVAVACSSLVFSVLSIPAIGRVTAAARDAGVPFGVSTAACLLLWAVFNATGALAGGALAGAVGTSTPWKVLAAMCFATGTVMYGRQRREHVGESLAARPVSSPGAIGGRLDGRCECSISSNSPAHLERVQARRRTGQGSDVSGIFVPDVPNARRLTDSFAPRYGQGGSISRALQSN